MYDFVNVRLNEYVRIQQFHEFKQTLLEYTLQRDFDEVKDRMGGLIRALEKETEAKEKLGIRCNDLMEKFNKLAMSKLDLEIYERARQKQEEDLTDKLEKIRASHRDLTTKHNVLDNEHKNSKIDIGRLKREMEEKAENEEVAKIWHHFLNYAEYKELKELYNKVMPELARYEQQTLESTDEIARFREIIVRFDEVLSEKSSKQEMRIFEQQCRDVYLTFETLDKVEKYTKREIKKVEDK